MRRNDHVLSPLMYGYQTTAPNDKENELAYTLADRQPSANLTDVIAQLDYLAQGSHVLNLGCGDGILERHAGSQRPYSFTSVDLEPAAINTLQQTFLQEAASPDDAAIVGSITELGSLPELQGRSFDAAVSWRVLHGVPPEHYENIFKDIHESLAPGSSFFVSVASDQDWKARALGEEYNPTGVNDCSGVMFRQHGIDRTNPFPVHFFSADELLALGADNGFEPVTFGEFSEPSGYAHLKGTDNTYLYTQFIAK